MTGTRFAIALLLCLGSALPALALGDGTGLFNRKSRLDPARVRQLVETVRSDPDEKRRKAAVLELAEADPRVHTDVIPTLVAALRKDGGATVRVAVAEVLGRYRMAFAHAGAALEAAVASDASQAVRDAAERTLWEYHLTGYRSTGLADGFAVQTPEPPIAGPARPRSPVTAEPPPAPAPVVPAVGTVPPAVAVPLPPVGPPPGPRVTPPIGLNGPRSILAGVPPYANPTVEPPVAKPQGFPVPTPATAEPLKLPRWPDAVTVGTPPPKLVLDLPSLVPPPDSK